jgi:hypothetical protein
MNQRCKALGLGSALFCSVTLFAQGQPGVIQGIVDAVNLDSLTTTVRDLSGQNGSKNGGMTDTIRSRWYATIGNSLALEYLEQRLKQLNLVPQRHEFSDPIGVPGINVLAEQRGDLFPLQKYIVCAHFDDTNYNDDAIAPGADDNASGCAAVLEAARLLSHFKTAYTVLYAFWNHEEIGSIGSDRYARQARARGDSIVGVLNLDMLGYDADNDSLMNVHTSSIARSTQWADTVASVNRVYGVGLKMRIQNPGSSSSDHAGFWRQGYTAVLIIEGFSGGDFNPYYHKSSDLVEHFNLSYFRRQAKLAIGSLALLAGILGPSGVAREPEVASHLRLEQNYPNPFNPSTTIRFGLPYKSQVSLIVYNTLGQQVATLVQGEQDAGYHEVRFDASGLSSGVYFYRLQAGTYIETRKLVMLR